MLTTAPTPSRSYGTLANCKIWDKAIELAKSGEWGYIERNELESALKSLDKG